MVDAPVLGTGAFGVRVRVSSRPFLNFLREVFLYEDIELSFCSRGRKMRSSTLGHPDSYGSSSSPTTQVSLFSSIFCWLNDGILNLFVKFMVAEK